MSNTIKFKSRATTQPPTPDPATIKDARIVKVTAKKGKLQIVIETDDPEQTAAKALLDLQGGPVSVTFEEAEAGE